jgi:hypothetical protein
MFRRPLQVRLCSYTIDLRGSKEGLTGEPPPPQSLVRGASLPASCPALCRASTNSSRMAVFKSWMAGTSPAMTEGAEPPPTTRTQPQNASAASAIMESAPAWMRARWAPVSGIICSKKKRAVTSLAFMRSVEPLAPSASFSEATLAIFAHM